MSDSTSGKCPVDLETRSLWSLWGGTKRPTPKGDDGGESNSAQSIPASLEEAAKHAQTPHPGQRLPLSTHRLESTIPRSSNNNTTSQNSPAHQIVDPSSTTTQSNSNGNSTTTWVYPSEQQVFNAMKRKGWNNVEEEAIPSFLQIHNSVNEKSWKQVQEWEAAASNSNSNAQVELSRFEGRPKDLTPKAWLLSTLGICDKPFDRHDWYVVVQNKDNDKDKDGTMDEKRYVLDFYMTGDDTGGMPRVEIDVRPALDSPQAFVQRGTRLLKEAFPGIARELDERMRRQR